MHPDLTGFRHCPGCGTAGSLGFEMGKAVRCARCGFRYFHNVAVAVSAVLVHEDRMLMARRAHDPAAGRLDFPGGFVDPDETLEDATVRELSEELGLRLDPERLVYLFSDSNRYPFAGITYRTSDVCFGLRLEQAPALHCADDVAEALWLRPEEVTPEKVSFEVVTRIVDRIRRTGLAALVP